MVVGSRGKYGLDPLRAPVIRDAENFRRVFFQPFDAAEEEQLVADDRSSEESAEALLAERGGLVEIVGSAVGK